jgi:hypothetical protein
MVWFGWLSFGMDRRPLSIIYCHRSGCGKDWTTPGAKQRIVEISLGDDSDGQFVSGVVLELIALATAQYVSLARSGAIISYWIG